MILALAASATLLTPALDPPQGGEAIDVIAEHVAAPSLTPNESLVEELNREGVAALRRLWSQTGVSSGLFADRDAAASLITALFVLELDGTADEETLLRVTDADGADFHFLALDRREDAWVSLGWIDLRNQRLEAPVHRVEALDDSHRWLVVTSLKGSGAGFERYQETWHALPGLGSVLSYPARGEVAGHGLPFNRTYRGTRTGLTSVDGQPRVDVEIVAEYTNGDAIPVEGLTHLLTRQEVVRYVFDADAAKFVLDEEHSGMTEAEIIGLFADDAQGFLQHNFAELKTIAASGDEPKRTWLRRFLEAREGSSERTILLDLIAPEAAASDDDGAN